MTQFFLLLHSIITYARIAHHGTFNKFFQELKTWKFLPQRRGMKMIIKRRAIRWWSRSKRNRRNFQLLCGKISDGTHNARIWSKIRHRGSFFWVIKQRKFGKILPFCEKQLASSSHLTKQTVFSQIFIAFRNIDCHICRTYLEREYHANLPFVAWGSKCFSLHRCWCTWLADECSRRDIAMVGRELGRDSACRDHTVDEWRSSFAWVCGSKAWWTFKFGKWCWLN